MEKRLSCSWECKLVLPLWRTVWRFLKKLRIELPYDPAIQLLGTNGENHTSRRYSQRRSQAGRGLGRGDHSPSYKFTKRITERRANFTKQLLIASWGHQAPRKAARCLRKEVGQNIKGKKRDKRAKDGDPSREGSLALAGLGEVFESRRATWLGGEQ